MRRTLGFVLAGVLGCQPEMSDMMAHGPMDLGPGDAAPKVDVWVPPADEPAEVLRVNHMQLRATVDSYHANSQTAGPGDPWFYEHLLPGEQAALQGIRAFDFDLDADDLGGVSLGVGATDTGRDGGSACGDWYRCLLRLAAWMDEHPNHALMIVLVGEMHLVISDRQALRFQLDDTEWGIREAIGRGRVISPAQMRGEHASLRARIQAEGWPSVESTRGKVMFVLNDRELARERYLERGGEDPDDKLLFLIGDPMTAEAADTGDEVVFTFEPDQHWMFETDPTAIDRMTELAESGYLVHGISDDPAMIARMRAAGAQMVGTRFPDEVFGDVPPDGAVACNPVTAPAACDASALENLE